MKSIPSIRYNALVTAMVLTVVANSAAHSQASGVEPDWPAEVLALLAPKVADNSEFMRSVIGAILEHPDVQRGEALTAEVRAARREVFSNYFPQVSIDVSGYDRLAESFGDRLDNITERSQPGSRLNASIIGRQLLYDGGATGHRYKSAKFGEKAGRAEADTLTESVAFQAIAAHYEVIRFRALRRLGKKHLGRHEEILIKAELRLRQGTGNAREVARILATMANIEVRQAAFDREARIAEARYEDYFGEVMSREYRPTITRSRRTLEALMAVAERSNPSLRRAVLIDRQQEASHKAEHLDWFPQIFAEVAATKFDVGKNNGDFTVTGRLSVRHAIFTGGARSARRNQSSARARQAKFKADAMRKTVRRNLAERSERFGALTHQEKILARAVSANGASRRLLMEQFRVSRGTITEFLDAEASYFQSSAEYLNNQVDSDLAFLELLFETGELLDLIGFPTRS